VAPAARTSGLPSIDIAGSIFQALCSVPWIIGTIIRSVMRSKGAAIPPHCPTRNASWPRPNSRSSSWLTDDLPYSPSPSSPHVLNTPQSSSATAYSSTPAPEPSVPSSDPTYSATAPSNAATASVLQETHPSTHWSAAAASCRTTAIHSPRTSTP